MTTCKHWSDIGSAHGGACGLHGGTRSFGVCANCKDNTSSDSWWLAFRKRHRLGDKIERTTRKVGIKPCAGCVKRKPYWNGEM